MINLASFLPFAQRLLRALRPALGAASEGLREGMTGAGRLRARLLAGEAQPVVSGPAGLLEALPAELRALRMHVAWGVFEGRAILALTSHRHVIERGWVKHRPKMMTLARNLLALNLLGHGKLWRGRIVGNSKPCHVRHNPP